MTPKPYTYTKLIQGHTTARNGLLGKLNSRGLTAEDTRDIHRQIDYLNEEIRRFTLTRKVCGDSTVLVR
jgi:hypothetical protein